MSESLSTMEYESLEQKYVEVKTKFKRSLQSNEKNTIQIQKLNKRIKLLEDENIQLQNQIQNFVNTTHDSESDVSSSDRPNQNETNMANLVHSKNLQISDLLKDIEDVERENILLREKLAETKDELSSATSEISSMTNTLKAKDVALQEQCDLTQKLSTEIESLQEQIEQCTKEKSEIEQNLEIFSSQVNKKVDEWKELLDQRNAEIAQLKSEHPNLIVKTPSSSSEDQEPFVTDGYLNTLKIALYEAETQLCVLKSEMEKCTLDLKENADIINKLKSENHDFEHKLKEMTEKEQEMKTQLSKSRDRCKNLQKEVEFSNKLTKVFEIDFSKLKAQLKDNGHIDLATCLEDNQSLKVQNLLHEKQIVGLIKEINQLQEMCNIFDIENGSLRQQLGIKAHETINIDPKFLSEGKKQQQLIEKLKTDIQNANEKNIKLKMEIKDLNKKIANLTNEILELKPDPEVKKQGSPKVVNTASEEHRKDIKALSEENEALRKGLHQILNSVKEKSDISPREVKSDVLERLLKALDAKHISGWYHPAMRLQAELHTLEGVNSELREQLHEARSEIEKFKMSLQEKEIKSPKKDLESAIDIKIVDDEKVNYVTKMLSGYNFRNLQELKINILKIITSIVESENSMEETLERGFEMVQKHMELIHETCRNEKAQLLEKLESDPNTKHEISQLLDDKNKTTYAIHEINKWKEDGFKMKKQIFNLEHIQSAQIEIFLKKIIFLHSKIRQKEMCSINSISMQQFREFKNSLNDQLIKYRKILADFEEQNKVVSLEIETLKQTEEDMTKEIVELKAKLKQVLCNSHQERHRYDQDCLTLSQKLADAEIQAMSEKQRADHTNNLYKLVKEQLRKSEENFAEFSKYGENLLQKNLSFQERVVDLEDKVSLYVDLDLYKELEEKLNSLVKEKEELISENVSLRQKSDDIKNPLNELSKWNHEKEQELLGLKHQIVDLTSSSDDKLLIGQLHSDLAKCRLEERELELKIDFLKNEVSHWERRYMELNARVDNERKHFEKATNIADKKISVLQNLLIKQRSQYHGYVPLISQEIYAEKIKNINQERHQTFLTLQNISKLENKLEFYPELETNRSEQENEWPYPTKRQNEFKEQQIQYLNSRIESQEKQLEKLEQELLTTYRNMDLNLQNNNNINVKKPVLVRNIVSQESLDPKTKEAQVKILRNMDSQTEAINNLQRDDEVTVLKVELKNFESQISSKAQLISEANNLLSQKETEMIKIKGQLDEKNRQVKFLEKKIMDIMDQSRDKKQDRQDNGAAGDGISVKNNLLDEQIISLRAALKSVQDRLSQKEVEILKYQTLLKEDRDKHSLAAANLHKELTSLQTTLVLEQQRSNSLEEATAISRQKSTVVEKYISQVRALESHLAELHTRQAQLESQLHATQQEANRWRQMAQERLVAMQELGKSLNEQHKKELTSYKTDYEKLKELSEEDTHKHKNGNNTAKPPGFIDPEVLKLCREKDEKIMELYTKLQKIENVDKMNLESSVPNNEKLTLAKENEVLLKRYEALIIKERNARDEVRDLKDQLSKRTSLSARTKQSEKSIKEQLQRKISQLEKEIDDLNDQLSQQMLLNEKHKLSANEDFGKWKKQKYWQENCEKYKSKLQEREDELQKLQQACTGFRMLIERLEREKINLENRIKTLKCNPRNTIAEREIELLKAENTRLTCELATLEDRMEIRQHGAGALGAALMQEKLEAQERKIAVLELSAKSTVEVRNELERLQASLSSLQKRNLCLEAENLELKMDLEKYGKETPHLQEQIQHLENYIELLKNENQSTSAERQMETVEDKKVSQLERTVFILKRVVEKLQVENKRLHSGKRPVSERSSSAEKLKRDYLRLKEQHAENLQKIKEVESKLAAANKKIQLLGKNQSDIAKVDSLRTQLEQAKEQLAHKTMLLDKVKALLHGAAAKEKLLLKEITELRSQSGTEKDFDTRCSIEIPSPIEEVSEENSELLST